MSSLFGLALLLASGASAQECSGIAEVVRGQPVQNIQACSKALNAYLAAFAEAKDQATKDGIALSINFALDALQRSDAATQDPAARAQVQAFFAANNAAISTVNNYVEDARNRAGGGRQGTPPPGPGAGGVPGGGDGRDGGEQGGGAPPGTNPPGGQPQGDGTPPPPPPQQQEQELDKKKDADSKEYGEVGDRYALDGRRDEAERAYTKALERSGGTDAELLGKRAQLRLNSGNREGALEDAERALALDPRNAVAKLIVGNSASLGRAARKTERIGKLGLSGGDDLARARELEKSSQFSRRLAGFSQGGGARLPAQSRAPGRRDPLLQNAERKRGIGDLRGAKSDAQRAVAAEPGRIEGWIVKSEIESQLGEYDQAAASAGKALEIDERDPRALRARAYALMSNGNLEEALALIVRAVELDPENGTGHLYRAMILEKLGRPDEAIASYREAARLDPALRPLAEAALRRLGASPAGPAKHALPSGPRDLLRYAVLALAGVLILWGLLRGARLVATTKRPADTE